MKIRAGEKYYLAWGSNPAVWNEDLKDLIAKEKVIKVNGRYYTRVTAHMNGNFAVVDCTCDSRGNFYPINTSLLKEIPYD